MRRLPLGAAILVLSCACTFARVSTPPTGQNPIGPPQSQQSDATKTGANRTSNQLGQTVEGCLSSVDDAFVLTDANGKTYQVTGDVAQLTGRIGNKVRLWGHASVPGELIPTGGPHVVFGVDRIESLSTSCK